MYDYCTQKNNYLLNESQLTNLIFNSSFEYQPCDEITSKEVSPCTLPPPYSPNSR